MPWHKNPDGTTNWGRVFESPSEGLIPLIERAQTLETLRGVSTVVIEKLFTRQQDAQHRRAYSIVLDGILPLDGLEEGKTFDHAKDEVIALMRKIKDERIQKAQEYIAKKQAEAAGQEKSDENRRLESKADKIAAALAPKKPKADPLPKTATELFNKVFADYYRLRFVSLRKGVTGKNPPAKKRPFILSEDFEKHFIGVLKETVIPRLAEYTSDLIDKAAELPEGARLEFLKKQLETRRTREKMWESWQLAWDESVDVTPLPTKPKEEKKGMLSSLGIGIEKKPKYGQKEMTLEEWKTKVKEIKKGNAAAEDTWKKIKVESDDYEPPLDSDKKVLKELFGRSPGAIAKQTTAIRQIFEQGGNVSRTFDNFMRTARNFDTSLLSVCWQLPELLLGEDKKLADVMTSYKQDFKNEHFHLTMRYIDLTPAKKEAIR